MKESGLIKSVTRLLPPEVHQQSMTFGSTSYGGTPDRYFDYRSDLWVEFKMAKTLGTKGYNVGAMLSDLQKEWLRRRHIAGENAWVLVGVPGKHTGGFILYTPEEWEGSVSRQFWEHRYMHSSSLAQAILARIS